MCQYEYQRKCSAMDKCRWNKCASMEGRPDIQIETQRECVWMLKIHKTYINRQNEDTLIAKSANECIDPPISHDRCNLCSAAPRDPVSRVTG